MDRMLIGLLTANAVAAASALYILGQIKAIW